MRPVSHAGGRLGGLFRPAALVQREATIYLTISCETPSSKARETAYQPALAAATRVLYEAKRQACHLFTSNEGFNDWLNRSFADIQMMNTETPEGPYPYAGVPWFSTPFGRDGLITALECLWTKPDMARGVLAYLASAQATEVIPEQDAEPGKILHEARRGEMAALGEIPFGKYYGSVDSTPLFIMLAGAYYERTGDLPLIQSIWPQVQLGLEWIDKYGDIDGDGFVEYARHSPTGLVQQGWKDSADSVFYNDGVLADRRSRLCEVQGYVFAAKRMAAQLALAWVSGGGCGIVAASRYASASVRGCLLVGDIIELRPRAGRTETPL